MARLQHHAAASRIKIRRGDTVRVLRGRDRGKTGKVLGVVPRHGRVVVEGVSMIFKHIRPRRAGEKGQRVSVAAPIPVANVQFVCPSCKRGARLGIDRRGGDRKRVCKACDTSLD